MVVTKSARVLSSFLFFALISFVGFGQSKNAFDKVAIIEEAKQQLIAMAASTGEMGVACAKNGITGEFVFDMTLHQKGSVLTVYMVSSSTDEVKDQNFVKSRLTKIEFEKIKIPKNERIKFRQTLTF
jgi:hypothetical protein